MSDWQMNQCAKEACEISALNDGMEIVVVYNESLRRYEAIAESATSPLKISPSWGNYPRLTTTKCWKH